MMHWKRRVAPYALSLFTCLSHPALAGGKTDFQIWDKNIVRGHLNKRLDLSLEAEFRYKNSGSTFYYNHEHVELPIHVTSFLTIGPAYRQIFQLNDNQRNQWTTTYYPNINIYFLWHLGPYHFYDRNRVSYVIKPGSPPNVWQYRNKLGVYRVLSDKLHGVRLFADNEIFIEQEQRGIYENRTTVGYNVGLFKKIRMDLAYRNRIVRITGGWEHDHILFISPSANF